MPDIKLPRIPDRKPLKLTISIMPELAAQLEDYASAYQAQYGANEDVSILVPYMLVNFLESDRAFQQSRKR